MHPQRFDHFQFLHTASNHKLSGDEEGLEAVMYFLPLSLLDLLAELSHEKFYIHVDASSLWGEPERAAHCWFLYLFMD